MLARYDPAGRRDYWLKFGLKIQTEFNPDSLPARAHPRYVNLKANSMVDACLVGLAGEVRPTVEKIARWMEGQPEPDRLVFSGAGESPDAWWFARYEWQQTLGLCKWLSRGDRAERSSQQRLRQCAGFGSSPSGGCCIAARHLRDASELSGDRACGNAPKLGLKYAKRLVQSGQLDSQLHYSPLDIGPAGIWQKVVSGTRIL